MSLPTMRAYGQFAAAVTPVAVNLDMGFVPDYFYMQAESLVAIAEVQWFKTAGDGKCMIFSFAGTATWLTTGIASWQPAGAATFPSRWAASTAVVLNQIVHPVGWTSPGVPAQGALSAVSPWNLPLFICTTAGTTGGAEPTWPTTIGATVTDGSAVWTAIDSKLWSTTGIDAAQQMLTGVSGTNLLGTLVSPAPSGLGVTVPTTCQTASAVYDWYAEGRVPSP